jgi:hypothetical protein
MAFSYAISIFGFLKSLGFVSPVLGRNARKFWGKSFPGPFPKDVRFEAVEARSSVRERLRSEGRDARLGGRDRFTSVGDAVDAFQKQTKI